MAVVKVEELQDRRRSSFRATNGSYTHYLLWLVTCDSIRDGPAAAITADGIPVPGSAFVDPAGNVAYLAGIDVDQRTNSSNHFEVNCEFTTPIDATQLDDNPLHQSPTWSFTYTDTTESYFTDESPTNAINAKEENGPFIVANSVGDAFEQFMQRDRGELQITMTRNEAKHDAVASDTYSHTVNTAVTSLDGNQFDIGTLKLSPIGAVKNNKTLRDGSKITYYTRTFVLKARHEGWHDKPLDVGYNELTGDKNANTQSIRSIVDSNGLPLKKPWPLDGKGKKKPNVTDAPAVLDFQPYTPVDFSPLNLDWDYTLSTPNP